MTSLRCANPDKIKRKLWAVSSKSIKMEASGWSSWDTFILCVFQVEMYFCSGQFSFFGYQPDFFGYRLFFARIWFSFTRISFSLISSTRLLIFLTAHISLSSLISTLNVFISSLNISISFFVSIHTKTKPSEDAQITVIVVPQIDQLLVMGILNWCRPPKGGTAHKIHWNVIIGLELVVT